MKNGVLDIKDYVVKEIHRLDLKIKSVKGESYSDNVIKEYLYGKKEALEGILHLIGVVENG